MARYLFCYPDVLQGDVPLFEGTSQYNRYSTRYAQLVCMLEIPLKKLGYEPGDLGTHSSRKGVATMVAAGCTVSPPIVSLCIRAGWVLGGVKDKYLFRENAGDQYVGRCASCLDQLTKEFAVSPAYFDFSDLNTNEKKNSKEKIDNFLASRLPNFINIPPRSLHLAKYCFASICYHYDFLKENLHEKCILRSSSIFRDIPIQISSLARVSYSWNKTPDTPKFTGIPPHVIHMVQIEELKKKIESMEENIMAGIRHEMDTRGFASNSHNTKCITDSIAALSSSLIKELIEKTNICDKSVKNAITAESIRDYNDFMMENEDDTENENETTIDLNEDFLEEERQIKRKRVRERAEESVNKRIFTVGFHHGAMNPLPPNYIFPSMTLSQLITNWCLGDKGANIPPLRRFVDSPHLLKHIKWGVKNFNMMKYLMLIVAKAGQNANCWKDHWDYNSVNYLLTTIVPPLKEKYLAKSNRKGEAAWKTVYNNMSKQKAFDIFR